ncbi:MAG: CoA transferase [Burkholderiaceae bacterium]
MPAAFDGVRVLDFSQVLAGPFAAHQLALLGADVIKVEPPAGGDQMRNRMLPSRYAQADMASAFMSLNVGKRSLALDLKAPRGMAVAHRLIERADVMLHNFRAGVVDRLELDYESVLEINPRIVYCSVTGYGNGGPRARDAAYDGAIQAASGMMANNGDAQSGPMRTGYFPVDMATGLTAAFAISSALFRRERTGRGQRLDIAMLDVAITMQSSAFAQFLVDGNPGGLIGNSSATRLPTANAFATADGIVLMSATTQGHFDAICAEMGREDLLADARFADTDARRTHAAELHAILLECFASDTASNWSARLGRRGVPVSRVNSIADTVAEPQLASRGVLIDVPAPMGVEHPVRLVGAGYLASEDGPSVASPPPGLGEHSRQVLAELGLPGAEIDALVTAGIVGAPA